jgi:REP-associated tyrosine transposase
MGRLPRASDDGLVDHALNRGNNRGDVLSDEADRDAFLTSLDRTQGRYPFRLFGYCLMSNHFHLLIRPEPGQTISRILQSLTVAHTGRYHRRHRTSGHVWQGRFKSPVIEDDFHLVVVLRSIETNPLRAKMVADRADYRGSSSRCHGLGQDDPRLSRFPEWEELAGTEAERRRRWRSKIRGEQAEAELSAVRHSLRSGQPFGGTDWSEATAKRLNLHPEPRRRGRPPKR